MFILRDANITFTDVRNLVQNLIRPENIRKQRGRQTQTVARVVSMIQTTVLSQYLSVINCYGFATKQLHPYQTY